MENLRHALSQLDSLPAIPDIAQKILALKIATDEGEIALLGLIAKDPTILSRIIGLANSPLFGANRKILTLKDATALLGSKRIKMIALSFAMLTFMNNKSGGMLDIQSLWKHSLAVAMTMESLSRLMPADRRPSSEEIYLAGLLHDIGFLVLVYLDPGLSDKFHARLSAEPGWPVEEIEAQVLEISHGEMGGELARRWGLPESIVAVLNYHHAPHDPRAAEGQPLVAMTNLAEKLLPTFGINEFVPPVIAAEEWQALGIDPANEPAIVAQAEQNQREVSMLFA